MTTTRRQFMGVSLTERPDGSAVLVVRGETEDLEIHLAPHVWADIGYRCYQRYSNHTVLNQEIQHARRRSA